MPEIDFHPSLGTWSTKTPRPKTEGRTTKMRSVYRPTTRSGPIQAHRLSSPSSPQIKFSSWSNPSPQQPSPRRVLSSSAPLIDARGLITRGSTFTRHPSTIEIRKFNNKDFAFSIPMIDKRYPPDRAQVFLRNATEAFHSTKTIHSSIGSPSKSVIHAIMTEANLHRHTEEAKKRYGVTLSDRIISWSKNIPVFETLDLHKLQQNQEILVDQVDTDSPPLPPRSSYSKSADRTKVSREGTLMQNNTKHSRSQTSLLPSLPAAAEPLLHSSHSQSVKRHHSNLSQKLLTNDPSKKLLCCLKIEIKSGIYKMLPVHNKDDPHQLAFAFCRSNNLLSSVSHLTEHIRQSKKTYGAVREN